jgi:hypothetical protein
MAVMLSSHNSSSSSSALQALLLPDKLPGHTRHSSGHLG